MGAPLAMYIHKDVLDHDRVVDLITVSSRAGRRIMIIARPTRLCVYLSNISDLQQPSIVAEFSIRFFFLFFSLPFSRSPVFLILFIRKMEALSPTLTVGSIIS